MVDNKVDRIWSAERDVNEVKHTLDDIKRIKDYVRLDLIGLNKDKQQVMKDEDYDELIKVYEALTAFEKGYMQRKLATAQIKLEIAKVSPDGDTIEYFNSLFGE